MYTKVAERVEVRGESVTSVCHSADSIDSRTLFCEMSSDSEESTISESSGDSSEQVDSGEEIEVVGHVEPYEDEPLASDDGDNEGEEDEVDADGLTPAVLEARFERQIAVREWLVKLSKYLNRTTVR